MTPERNSENLYAALEVFLDGPVHVWPLPARRRPSILSHAERRAEKKINAALKLAWMPPIDEGFRRLFWEEYGFGQIHEDAGGFLWRCWCRAMQQPNEFLTRYGRGHDA